MIWLVIPNTYFIQLIVATAKKNSFSLSLSTPFSSFRLDVIFILLWYRDDFDMSFANF